MYKKVFYNTVFQVFGKAFTATITLIITLLIARTLGPAGFGEFTKIFVFVGYFYTFADFGLNSIYVRTADKKSEFNLFKVLVGVRLILALILFAAAISISFVLPYDLVKQTGFSPLVKAGILIGSLTILTQALFTTANAYFQRNLRYDLSTIAAIAGYLVILTSTLAITFSGGNLLGYVASYVLGGFVLVCAAYFLITKRIKKFILPKFEKSSTQRLVSASWPIGLALIFNLIYFRIDVLILSNFRESSEVGIYGLAYQFFEAALALPIFLVNAIYPLLNEEFLKKSYSKFKSHIKRTLVILLSLSVFLTGFLIAVSFLIPAIYDARFIGSQTALAVLALGMPFFFISALLWHLLIIIKKQKYLALIYFSGAAFNIILNLIYIPQFGYMAAAIVTVVSEAFILLLLVVAVLKSQRNIISKI